MEHAGRRGGTPSVDRRGLQYIERDRRYRGHEEGHGGDVLCRAVLSV